MVAAVAVVVLLRMLMAAMFLSMLDRYAAEEDDRCP
jgi:hypothetical protein